MLRPCLELFIRVVSDTRALQLNLQGLGHSGVCARGTTRFYYQILSSPEHPEHHHSEHRSMNSFVTSQEGSTEGLSLWSLHVLVLFVWVFSWQANPVASPEMDWQHVQGGSSRQHHWVQRR